MVATCSSPGDDGEDIDPPEALVGGGGERGALVGVGEFAELGDALSARVRHEDLLQRRLDRIAEVGEHERGASSANRSAVVRPMPCAAPTTSAVLHGEASIAMSPPSHSSAMNEPHTFR